MKEPIIYTCPQCLYTTNKKYNMIHHFEKKNPCPLLDNGIELTEAIKKNVLQKRYQASSKINSNDKPIVNLHIHIHLSSHS
jgi:hypothetical protein